MVAAIDRVGMEQKYGGAGFTTGSGSKGAAGFDPESDADSHEDEGHEYGADEGTRPQQTVASPGKIPMLYDRDRGGQGHTIEGVVPAYLLT